MRANSAWPLRLARAGLRIALLAAAWSGDFTGYASADPLKPFDIRRFDNHDSDTAGAAPTHHAAGKAKPHGDLLRSGTAFFISRSGDMLTSAHVVRGCKRIDVWPGDQPGFQATLVAIDNDLDVALLSTDRTVDTTAPPVDQPLAPGAPVYTIGFGLTPSSPRVPVLTHGVVDGMVENKGRHLLVLRAALHEGNSGGPVVDSKGMLRGMIIGRYTDRPELGVAVRAQDLARFIGPDRNDASALPLHPPVGVKVSVRLRQVAALVQCTM